MHDDSRHLDPEDLGVKPGAGEPRPASAEPRPVADGSDDTAEGGGPSSHQPEARKSPETHKPQDTPQEKPQLKPATPIDTSAMADHQTPHHDAPHAPDAGGSGAGADALSRDGRGDGDRDYDGEAILAYVEGEMTEQAIAAFEQQLADDPPLRKLVGQMMVDRQKLRQLAALTGPVKAPSDLMEVVNQALEREMLLDDGSRGPATQPIEPDRLTLVGAVGTIGELGSVDSLADSGKGSEPSTAADTPFAQTAVDSEARHGSHAPLRISRWLAYASVAALFVLSASLVWQTFKDMWGVETHLHSGDDSLAKTDGDTELKKFGDDGKSGGLGQDTLAANNGKTAEIAGQNDKPDTDDAGANAPGNSGRSNAADGRFAYADAQRWQTDRVEADADAIAMLTTDEDSVEALLDARRTALNKLADTLRLDASLANKAAADANTEQLSVVTLKAKDTEAKALERPTPPGSRKQNAQAEAENLAEDGADEKSPLARRGAAMKGVAQGTTPDADDKHLGDAVDKGAHKELAKTRLADPPAPPAKPAPKAPAPADGAAPRVDSPRAIAPTAGRASEGASEGATGGSATKKSMKPQAASGKKATGEKKRPIDLAMEQARKRAKANSDPAVDPAATPTLDKSAAPAAIAGAHTGDAPAGVTGDAKPATAGASPDPKADAQLTDDAEAGDSGNPALNGGAARPKLGAGKRSGEGQVARPRMSNAPGAAKDVAQQGFGQADVKRDDHAEGPDREQQDAHAEAKDSKLRMLKDRAPGAEQDGQSKQVEVTTPSPAMRLYVVAGDPAAVHLTLDRWAKQQGITRFQTEEESRAEHKAEAEASAANGAKDTAKAGDEASASTEPADAIAAKIADKAEQLAKKHAQQQGQGGGQGQSKPADVAANDDARDADGKLESPNRVRDTKAGAIAPSSANAPGKPVAERVIRLRLRADQLPQLMAMLQHMNQKAKGKPTAALLSTTVQRYRLQVADDASNARPDDAAGRQGGVGQPRRANPTESKSDNRRVATESLQRDEPASLLEADWGGILQQQLPLIPSESLRESQRQLLVEVRVTAN